MTTTLMLLIDRRLTLITDKLRDIAHFRIQYYLRNSFDNSDKVHSMGILPNLINETMFKFTDEQQRLLSRGPAYVLPAQMYSSVLSSSSSSSTLSMDDVLKKYYAPLQHHLASLFSKHHVNIALSMEMNKVINDRFKDLFSLSSIPTSMQQRALLEKQLVQSIRQLLQEHDLILRRTTDDQNTFYVADRTVFEAKAKEYLQTMANTYPVVVRRNLEDENDEAMKNEVNDMIDSINMSLGILKSRKLLDSEVIQRMELDRSKVRLPYLYFLPDVSKVSVSFVVLKSCPRVFYLEK
jgi:DNA-binding transcriptional regulator GbsR (MarR family)